MRTTSASSEAMLASDTHYRARCARIETRYGEVLALTDHDAPLTLTLADAGVYEETYSPMAGMMPGEIAMGLGLDVDSCEISGPISSLVTAAGILGRKYTGARVWIFDTDWRDPDGNEIPYLYGRVAECYLDGRKWTLEVRNQFDRLNQTIGRVLSPYCTADYGDTQCGVARTAYITTVAAVTDSFNFTLDLAGDHADDFFNLGTIEFETGTLAGIEPYEIFDYVGSSALTQLFAALPEPPEVGDQVRLYRGCSKLKSSTNASLPTCLTNNNVPRFRGFDRVPGSDNYLKIPVPGTTG